ncbi:ABC transporter permease [Kribbella sp. NPDC051620]|uniref:ABC transporter permease n=1 Tax=Kribbella sp. NPDC051620 TaxID=3364120 RepID=UPI0037B4B76E
MSISAESAAPEAMRPRAQRARRRRSRVLHYAEAYALLGLTAVVAVVFSLHPATRETFPTLINTQAVLANQAVMAVVALAALLPLVCNGWDLSVGAVCGLSSIVMARTMSEGHGVAVALLFGLLVGLAVGSLNALLVTRARVNAVIATLGVATVLAGAVNQITGGLTVVSNIPVFVTSLGSGRFLGLPWVAYVMIVVALLVYYVLEHTPAGRYLYALGSNATAARLAGLRTRVLLASTFICAGLLSALGGFLQVARSAGADPRIGDSLTLPALAAAFLSAAAIKPGRYNVWGTIVAIFFLATLNSGLNLSGVPPYVNSYVNGAALVVGVGIAGLLGRRRAGLT